MTIQQQPDLLNFCENLKKIVLTGVENDLSFTLSCDDVVLVSEVYTPADGLVEIDCRDVIREELSVKIPPAGSAFIVQEQAIKEFVAIIGATTISFKVVKGGINIAETSYNFFKYNWLTLQPQVKFIESRQPEYLSYYAVSECNVKIKAYFQDKTTEEKILLGFEAGKLYSIDCSYGVINNKFLKDVRYYDLWVEDSLASRWSYIQRFVLEGDKDTSQIYIFENTLSGIDTVVFGGTFEEKIVTTGSLSTRTELTTDTDINFDFYCEQNTGFIPNPDYAKWLRGFFVSKQRYHLSDATRQIYLKETENKFDRGELSSYTFEFYYSKRTSCFNVIRNVDILPELLEFPVTEDFFFIAPRLSDFPYASVADDLLLPAQFAFENKWRKISIAAIVEAAIVASLDASSVSFKDYWKKTELVREDLYLKFLDRKIFAGYADDAGKWEGKKFDDYLNQPVRTFDDLEFNSLLTKLVTAVKVIVTEFGTDNFIPGFAGTGTGIFNRDELHSDKIIARKSIEALALVVQKMFYRGGMNVLSPAGMKINKVEDGDGFWRCYFEDSDGQTNDFTVNAQARCNNFGTNLKYYWGLVIAVGSNYIDISKTDKDGSGIPEIGDELVQMGHRTDPNLQWVIIDSSLSADAGRTVYGGVNSFSLEGKAVMRTGVDPVDSSKVGIYVSNGRFENVQIGTGCTGLGNMAEFQAAQESIQEAQGAAASAIQKVDNLQIGGSNLINYLVEDGTSAWQGSAATVTVVNDVIKAQCTGAGQWPRLINASVRSATFDTTKKYTISFKIRSNRAAAVQFGISNLDQTNIVVNNYTPALSGEFVEFKHTFVPARNVTQSGYFFIYAGEVKPAPHDSTSFIEVKDVKLETGEKATGMSRSDFDNEVIAKLQGLAGGQEAVDKVQIGMVNLLKGSNVELEVRGYCMGKYYFDKKPEIGKTYTLVVCYTLIEANDYIIAFQDTGYFNILPALNSRVAKVVESRTFTCTSTRDDGFMSFYQLPNGTYGSTIHWAVLVEGNKGPHAWIPSLSEQGEGAAKDAIDNLQIGGVNLISKKMMLAWNNVAAGIATWGQDSTTKEIYLAVNQGLLYRNIANATEYRDIFLGEGNYKASTQYLLQVDWCLTAAQEYNGLSLYVYYMDGTFGGFSVHKDQVTRTTGYIITLPGKTIKKISCSYGQSVQLTKIYDIGLFIANKPLTQIISAREDLEGQSNVNLLSNSKFTFGTKGYDPNQSVTFNVVSGILQVRTTQTSSTPGICLPMVNLKTGVYTFKTSIRGVNISQFVCGVWKGNLVTSVYSKPVLFSNNFAEYKFTFVIPEDGDYRLLIYMSAAAASGSPYGFDVEYSTLTPGFVAPAGWFPAPADTELNTKDSFAVEMGYTSFQDLINKAAEKGKLTVDGLLNANLINVDTLFANQAFITKLKGVEFNFTKGTFGGFTATSELLYSGALLGSGAAGIQMKSSQNDWGFNVHKGDNDYVEMYYRSATNWGIKGVIEGDTVFQLGNNNQVAGWGITTTGFQSKTFSWPTYNRSGSLTEGGAGAKLFPNGAFMFCATETGMLQPSTGLLQAGLITAIADNAMVRGLEIRAQSNGYLKEVYTLILSAKNTYSNPSKLPIALLIEDGSLKLNGAEIYGIRVVGTGGTVSTKGVSVMKVTSTTSGNRLVLGPGDEGQRIEVINDTLGDLFINTARDEQTYNFIKGKSKKSLIFSGTSWYGEADNN